MNEEIARVIKVLEQITKTQKEQLENMRLMHERIVELERVILLVDSALEGARIVGTDQNRLGWRDFLGAAALKISKAKAR